MGAYGKPLVVLPHTIVFAPGMPLAVTPHQQVSVGPEAGQTATPAPLHRPGVGTVRDS